MGAHVVAFTTSEAKREAAKALGADEVVNSRNADEMAAHMKSFDFILNTVAAPHNLDEYTTLLKRDGTMTTGRRARYAAQITGSLQPDHETPRDCGVDDWRYP